MRHQDFLSIALISLITVSGCAGFHTSAVRNSLRPSEKSSQWNVFKRDAAKKKSSNNKQEAPVNMVVIWKDAVLENTGSASVRGFGARIYFHDAQNQPVKAEGELIVYGFDDPNYSTEVSTRTPTKKFVFTNEQFQSHYSESDLGASYSIWLPWEPVGNYRKSIALVPVFKTSDGKLINGGSSTNVLPGKPPADDKHIVSASKPRQLKSKEVVTLASYSPGSADPKRADAAVFDEEESSDAKPRTTTINLTPSMASRLTTSVEPSPNRSNASLLPPADVQTFSPAVPNAEQKPPQTSTPSSESHPTELSADSPRETTSTASNASSNQGTSTRKPAPIFGVPGAFR